MSIKYSLKDLGWNIRTLYNEASFNKKTLACIFAAANIITLTNSAVVGYEISPMFCGSGSALGAGLSFVAAPLATGKVWNNEDEYFDRFPARFAGKVMKEATAWTGFVGNYVSMGVVGGFGFLSAYAGHAAGMTVGIAVCLNDTEEELKNAPFSQFLARDAKKREAEQQVKEAKIAAPPKL